MQGHETVVSLGTVGFHLLHYTLYRLLGTQVPGLGEKFVGVAYQLLLQTQGQHIAVRQRKVPLHYLPGGNAGTGMALTHKGVARQTLGFKNGATFYSMADVWFGTETTYGGSVYAHHPYVVEHGRFRHKEEVHIQHPDTRYFKGLVSYGLGVAGKDM